MVEPDHRGRRQPGAVVVDHRHDLLDRTQARDDERPRPPQQGDHRRALVEQPQAVAMIDAVVGVPRGIVRAARVEVGVEAGVNPAQRLAAMVGDGEVEAGDAVVAWERPAVDFLVHRELQRPVLLAIGVHVVHRLGTVVHEVGGHRLLRREAEILVDLAVAVVVTIVQQLLVDRAVAVVVHGALGAAASVPGGPHPVLGIRRRPPLEQRSARDHRPLIGLRADPQRRVAQQLLAGAGRELERGVERALREGVADDARVGDAHLERAALEGRPVVVDVEHREQGCGRCRGERERERRRKRVSKHRSMHRPLRRGRPVQGAW